MAVNPIFVLVLLTLVVRVAFAGDKCSPPAEFQPALCPLRLPAISSIRIEENGAKSPAEEETALDCSSFRLTPRAVRRYLTRARTANEDDAHHTLDWSPCYASGTVAFVDGRSGRWSVTQSGIGSLVIEGGASWFLYCPSCRHSPFRQ